MNYAILFAILASIASQLHGRGIFRPSKPKSAPKASPKGSNRGKHRVNDDRDVRRSVVEGLGEVVAVYEVGSKNTSVGGGITGNSRLYLELSLSNLDIFEGCKEKKCSGLSSQSIQLPMAASKNTPFNHAMLNFHERFKVSVAFYAARQEDREQWSCETKMNNECDSDLFANELFYEVPPDHRYPVAFASSDPFENTAMPFVGLRNTLAFKSTLSTVAPSLLSYSGYCVGTEIHISRTFFSSSSTLKGLYPQPHDTWLWSVDADSKNSPVVWFAEVDLDADTLSVGFELVNATVVVTDVEVIMDENSRAEFVQSSDGVESEALARSASQIFGLTMSFAFAAVLLIMAVVHSIARESVFASRCSVSSTNNLSGDFDMQEVGVKQATEKQKRRLLTEYLELQAHMSEECDGDDLGVDSNVSNIDAVVMNALSSSQLRRSRAPPAGFPNSGDLYDPSSQMALGMNMRVAESNPNAKLGGKANNNNKKFLKKGKKIISSRTLERESQLESMEHDRDRGMLE